MTNAESIQALMREICVLIEGNIRPDGECQFDSVKVKLALELVKYELQSGLTITWGDAIIKNISIRDFPKRIPKYLRFQSVS